MLVNINVFSEWGQSASAKNHSSFYISTLCSCSLQHIYVHPHNHPAGYTRHLLFYLFTQPGKVQGRIGSGLSITIQWITIAFSILIMLVPSATQEQIMPWGSHYTVMVSCYFIGRQMLPSLSRFSDVVVKQVSFMTCSR